MHVRARPHSQDMVKQFETISMSMGEPGADIDALSAKMDRLQVRASAVTAIGCGGGPTAL